MPACTRQSPHRQVRKAPALRRSYSLTGACARVIQTSADDASRARNRRTRTFLSLKFGVLETEQLRHHKPEIWGLAKKALCINEIGLHGPSRARNEPVGHVEEQGTGSRRGLGGSFRLDEPADSCRPRS